MHLRSRAQGLRIAFDSLRLPVLDKTLCQMVIAKRKRVPSAKIANGRLAKRMARRVASKQARDGYPGKGGRVSSGKRRLHFKGAFWEFVVYLKRF